MVYKKCLFGIEKTDNLDKVAEMARYIKIGSRYVPVTNATANNKMTTITTDGERLNVTELAKSFGGVVALNGASLIAHVREILSFISPNGAGKTTLINTNAVLRVAAHGCG